MLIFKNYQILQNKFQQRNTSPLWLFPKADSFRSLAIPYIIKVASVEKGCVFHMKSKKLATREVK